MFTNPYLLALCGLALLMVVHEGGHCLAARAFGMRVVKFSIGFGPTLFKYRPKGGETLYQVALIPFLAYVQIAGMNPYEEDTSPNDAGSYAHASLLGRVVTVIAGPAANYLFASFLLVAGLLVGGRLHVDEQSMRVTVSRGGPAETAGMVTGDKILAIDEQEIHDWDTLRVAIARRPSEVHAVRIEREGDIRTLHVTPSTQEPYKGKLLISPAVRSVPVGVGEAIRESLSAPPRIVYALCVGLGRMITGKEKVQLSGPVGIVQEMAGAARSGSGDLLKSLGILSAYLCGFNLLPIPALDGGRLLFLGVEALLRRKLDAKMEARVHAVGMMSMLALLVLVTWKDLMSH